MNRRRHLGMYFVRLVIAVTAFIFSVELTRFILTADRTDVIGGANSIVERQILDEQQRLNSLVCFCLDVISWLAECYRILRIHARKASST